MDKPKYDDTYIVDCILEQCREIIEDFTYRDEDEEHSGRFGTLAHLDVTEAYFVAKYTREWIEKMRGKDKEKEKNMDKKTSDRFFNLRVKEKEDLESRMMRYYADFLIITALLLACGIGGVVLYAMINGGSQ